MESERWRAMRHPRRRDRARYRQWGGYVLCAGGQKICLGWIAGGIEGRGQTQIRLPGVSRLVRAARHSGRHLVGTDACGHGPRVQDGCDQNEDERSSETTHDASDTTAGWRRCQIDQRTLALPSWSRQPFHAGWQLEGDPVAACESREVLCAAAALSPRNHSVLRARGPTPANQSSNERLS